MSELVQELAENHGLFDQGEFRYEDFKAAINEALEWAAGQCEAESNRFRPGISQKVGAHCAQAIRAGKSA
jgi:hypothetical protein